MAVTFDPDLLIYVTRQAKMGIRTYADSAASDLRATLSADESMATYLTEYRTVQLSDQTAQADLRATLSAYVRRPYLARRVTYQV